MATKTLRQNTVSKMTD